MHKIVKCATVSIIVICIFITYKHFTYNFYHTNGEKEGELVTSPNGAYSAQLYIQSYGGAAGGVNIFVNVTFHLENDVERTVYYSDGKSNVRLSWLDESSLEITNYDAYTDRSVALKVENEIYDENGGACRTYTIKKEYVCYSTSS